MKSSRERFWQQVAMALDELNVALLQDDAASLELGEREYMAVQKRLLRQTETDRERQHLKRLIAHSVLRFAYSVATTWTEYQRALRRVRQLGYLNVDYRSRAANFTLLWVADNDPTKASLGWEMVEEAERRLRRLRRGSQVRRQALAATASVKQRVTRQGLMPPAQPASPGTSRRRGSRIAS